MNKYQILLLKVGTKNDGTNQCFSVDIFLVC